MVRHLLTLVELASLKHNIIIFEEDINVFSGTEEHTKLFSAKETWEMWKLNLK